MEDGDVSGTERVEVLVFVIDETVVVFEEVTGEVEFVCTSEVVSVVVG